jgi:PAS domain S-box-containing protein
MDNSSHHTTDESLVNPPFTDFGAWDWDIISGDVQWFGTHERLIDMPTKKLSGKVEAFSEVLHPDDRARVWKKVLGMMARRETEYSDQFRFLYPNGTVRWMSGRGRFYYDDTGRPVRMAGVVQDDTVRRRQEHALRDSEARFRNVFEHAGTGIAIINMDGNFVRCNPAFCAMLGYNEQELLDLSVHQVIHPDDRVDKLAAIERLMNEEIPSVEIEHRYVHKEGQPVWTHKFVSLLHDHEGKPQHLVALVTNVTERRQAEQALREAQEKLQRWNIELEQVVNVKTVELTQSQERLRALASELSLAEQRERKRLATELHDHLQQLLVYGKLTIRQGKGRVAEVPGAAEVMTKLDNVLSDALTYSHTLVAELSPPVLRNQGLAAGLTWLGEYMKKYNQAVTVHVPEQQPLSLPEAHRILLFQSVRELLINAAKYAGTGNATVLMEHHEECLQITVSDEGQGFDPAAVGGTPNGALSSKFGLFSIQERMRALNGSCIVHSAPGQGTTITLVLPLTRRAEAKVHFDHWRDGRWASPQ